jgi:hypothetical protein
MLLVPQISSLLWWLHTSSAIHFRGWINAEYLLLLSVAVLFPSRRMIALLTAELAASLIEPIAHLYYFSPADTIHSLRYLLLIPFPRLAAYACLFVAPALERLYRVQTGTVPFVGGTTSGETRELCGDSRGRYGFTTGYANFTACWPARLDNAGYHTLAVHGFTPTMFGRKDWYRQFGFQESEFLPELERNGASLCDGAFLGACDADVAQWVGTRLLASRDQHAMFVHWVTLNSHLPIAQLESATSLEPCRSVDIDQDRSLCSWFLHVLRVQNSVAKLALAPGLRLTVFIIVGDHAPPFLNATIWQRFSQTSVPYVVLLPKRVLMSRSAQLETSAPRSLQPSVGIQQAQ